VSLKTSSSKCSVSHLQRLKRDLLWGRGYKIGSRGGVVKGVYCSLVLVGCPASISSRPVAMANLIVARTASIFGVHVAKSVGAFPPK